MSQAVAVGKTRMKKKFAKKQRQTVENEIAQKGAKKIVAKLGEKLHSGVIFAAITHLVEVFVFTMCAISGFLVLFSYFLPLIAFRWGVQIGIRFNAGVVEATPMFFLPLAFLLIVVSVSYLKVCKWGWHQIRSFGAKTIGARKDFLTKKYGK